MFSFCKPVSSKKRFLPFRELDENFSFTLFERAEALPADQWQRITGDGCVFLNRDYLKIVEGGRHTKLMARYVIVYYHGKPCGIIYFQVVDFKAEVFGEILGEQLETSGSKRLKIFENYLGANKDEVLLRLFTCGNNLVSGEYGFMFNKMVSQEQATELLLNITEVVSKEDRLKGGLSAILIKDFHQPLQPESVYREEKYSSFHVEPNLIVQIPPGVHSLEAYIALFSKKYRNRAKSIFKSIQNLEQRTLDEEEIKSREKEIYALYEQVFEKAKFRLIKLPPAYFSDVKNIFKTRFNINGIFMNNELVAFSSSFLMPDGSLEAHYIGFKYELNHELNLYQNILYSLINEAIQKKSSKVNLGRTAAEIKTTVGARPEDLICYIKPQNTISRIIQKPFIGLLQPAEWIPRNPFKETTEKSSDSLPLTKS
jgi:hypothetical protein